MTQYKPPGPIVEVEWVDSIGHNGWQSRDPIKGVIAAETMLQRSAGYLVARSSHSVAIALSYGVSTPMVGDLMQIPRAAVKRITVLRK